MPINLPEQQKMTGKVLKHIAGNGPVYIRSSANVQFEVRYYIIYTLQCVNTLAWYYCVLCDPNAMY